MRKGDSRPAEVAAKDLALNRRSVGEASVSVIIPCFNEERYIGPCLDSLLENKHQLDFLEILVVDGGSTDRTREIVSEYAERHPLIRLLDNPRKSPPAALNIGIRSAVSAVILRADAHSTYPSLYIQKCVDTLASHGADNVGGVIRTLPGRDSLVARAIAISISHPFGVGISWFRISTTKTRVVDTVPFGCFRAELFSRIGEFDEELSRNEDIDLNQRIRRAGGKIVLNPEISCDYYSRGTISEFLRHNFANGYLVTAPWGIGKGRGSARHLVPLVSLIALTGLALSTIWLLPMRSLVSSVLAAYAVMAVLVAIGSATRRRDPGLLFALPLAFATLHISYGVGSVCGALMAFKRRWDGRKPLAL